MRYHANDTTGLPSCTLGDLAATDACFAVKRLEFSLLRTVLVENVIAAYNPSNLTGIEAALKTFFCTRAEDFVYACTECLPFPPCKGPDGDFGRKVRASPAATD
jgi:hypothetical protein